MFTRKLHVALTIGAVALLLAGCSGSGEASSAKSTTGATQEETAATAEASTDQSKAEACTIVKDNLLKFSDVSAKLDASDPQAMIDQFSELAADSGAALSSITNADVAPAATAAAAGLNEYVDFLRAVVADPSKASGLADQVTALTESVTEVATTCAG